MLGNCDDQWTWRYMSALYVSMITCTLVRITCMRCERRLLFADANEFYAGVMEILEPSWVLRGCFCMLAFSLILLKISG